MIGSVITSQFFSNYSIDYIRQVWHKEIKRWKICCLILFCRKYRCIQFIFYWMISFILLSLFYTIQLQIIRKRFFVYRAVKKFLYVVGRMLQAELIINSNSIAKLHKNRVQRLFPSSVFPLCGVQKFLWSKNCTCF